MNEAVDLGTGEVRDDVESTVSSSYRAADPGRPKMSLVDAAKKLGDPSHRKAVTTLRERIAAEFEALPESATNTEDYGKGRVERFPNREGYHLLDQALEVDTILLSLDGWWSQDPETETWHYTSRAVVRKMMPWGQFKDNVGTCSTRESRWYSSGGAPCPKCGGPTWDNRKPRKDEPAFVTEKRERGEHFSCKDSNCGGVVRKGEYDESEIGEKIPNLELRRKAEHDADATAVTRASNRASADLYGKGEVSAEERTIGGEAKDIDRGAGGGKSSGGPSKSDAPFDPETATCPFNKHKGEIWIDVIRTDPGYAEFLLGWDSDSQTWDDGESKFRNATERDALRRAVEAERERVSGYSLTDEDRKKLEDYHRTKRLSTAQEEWIISVLNGRTKVSKAGLEESLRKLEALPDDTGDSGDDSGSASDADDDEYTEDDLPF